MPDDSPVFPRRRLNRNAAKPMRLEQRLMFDGAAVDTAVEAISQPALDTVIDAIVPAAAPARQEIAFVDTQLVDWQTLVGQLGDQVDVVMLESGRDGLAQITEALAAREAVDAVHIFSHGTTGRIDLGNTRIDGNVLAVRAGEIEAWREHLAAEADILLYGCDVADGALGTDFVATLANLTGADVAASENDTGESSAGGDWILEHHYGTIDAAAYDLPNYAHLLTAEGFSTYNWSGVDTAADPLRMITWNVIGLDSNKPEAEGPDTFMVGLRVNSNGAGLSGMTIKIVDDDGIDVFGNGIIFADSTTPTSDFDDGVDNIQFVNATEYRNITIDGTTGYSDGQGGYYRDFYFNVSVQRLLSSMGQIQPFHFEVFKDANADGVSDVATTDALYQKLDRFSWLPDTAAANTPLYLYVEHYISQARNDVTNETYPSDTASAIRIDGYTNVAGGYDNSLLTIFVGQDLNIRTEGQTATQGYPQLTVSTVFDTSIFQINRSLQYYAEPVLDPTYQQELGSGDYTTLSYVPFDYIGGDASGATTGDPNTSVYANPAGWNPATHSLMITSAPPKAGGGPIVTDYSVTVSGTGAGDLSTLILDYSGSSFHYNADLNSGVEGIDFVQFQAVKGTIVGTVKVDTDGDGIGDTAIAGVTVTLTGILDTNMNGVIDAGETTAVALRTATTDANGNYVFTNLLPGVYTVTESAVAGYADVGDTDGGNKNQVQVVIGPDVTIDTVAGLGLTGTMAVNESGTTSALVGSDLLGYQRADFVEGRPDLQLTKAVSTTAPQLNGTVTYTLTVTNTSGADAPYVEVTDKLPAGLSFVSSNGGSGGDGTYNSATGVWTLSSGVAAGTSQTIQITATVTSSDAISNFAEITAIKTAAGGSNLTDPDSTVGNNAGQDNIYGTNDDGTDHTTLEDDEARVTIEAKESDLSLIKTVSNSRPNVGDEITFTLVVTNSGPDAATNISIADALPAGLSYDRAADNDTNADGAGFYSDDYTASAGTFDGSHWTIASLANGATATLVVRVKVTGVAALTNTAEIVAVDQYDPDSSKNNHAAGEDDQSSTVVTPVSADLSVSIVASNKVPDAGQTMTYTVIVSNSGPDATSGVTVESLLPNGVTYVSDSGGGAYSNTTHVWTIPGSIASGETKTLVITVTVNTNASGSLVATAEIKSSSLPDPDSSVSSSMGVDDLGDGIADDDESSATIVVGSADLSLLKSVSNSRPAPNEEVTYTITLINSGPKDATGVAISDVIPDGLKNVNTITGGGVYANGTITWTGLSVAAGSTLTLTYKATLDVTGSNFTNVAQITGADQVDPDSDPTKGLTEDDDGDGNPIDDDEAILTITPQMADLELTMTIDDADGIIAKNTNYRTTITVINKGPVAAYDVLSQFAKDASFVYSGTPTASRGTYDTATGVWTIGSLDVGDSVTLVFDSYHTMNSGSMTQTAQITQVRNAAGTSLADVDSTPNNYATLPNEDDSEAVTVSTSSLNSRVDLELGMTGVLSYDANGNGQLDAGDRVTYTINAYNKDAADSTQPLVTIYWPSTYLTYHSSSVTAGSLKDSDATDGTLVWEPTNSGPKLAGNTTSGVTLTLTGTVTVAGAGQNIVTSAEFTNGSGADPDSTVNNGVVSEDDYASAIIGPSRPDLELSMTVNKASPSPGDRVMFTLQVTNKGLDATNVTVDAPVPAGLTYKSYLGDGTWAGNVWTIPKVGGGQTVTLYLYADVDPATTGPIGNFAQITSMTVNGTVINDTTTAAANPTKTDTDSTPNDNAGGTRTPYQDDEARVSLNVIATQNVADLSLVKLADVTGNNTIDFKLIITNNGPQTAYDVKVTDSLPSGVTIGSVTAPAGTSYSGGVWTINSIAVGQVFVLTIPVSGASGTVTNFAEITQSLASTGGAPLADPDSTPDVDGDGVPDQDDEARVVVTMPSADLSLIKSVSNPNPNVVGNVSDAAEITAKSFSFSLTVVNSGPDSATNVSVADILPANFILTNTAFNTVANSDTYSSGTWTLGTVAVGEVHTMTLTGYITTAAAFTNFAEIKTVDQADPDSQKNNDNGDRTPNEDDEAAVTVTPQAADLQLSKSVSNATPNVGSDVTFTLTLVNAGPNNATNVEVKDYLPAGMTYVSDDGGIYTAESSGTITWTAGNIAVGEVKTLHIVARITSANAISNFAQVTAVDQYDPDSTKNNDSGRTANEDDEASVTVDAREADLSLVKTVNNATPMVGDNVIFTITVTNSSDDDATGVEVTDSLPAGFTFVSATGATTQPTVGANGGAIQWSGLTIAAHSSRSFIVVATATSASPLSNVAQITASDLPDPDSQPNNGTGDDYATVTVDAQSADLSVTKTVDNAAGVWDNTLHAYLATFSITVTNLGTDAATNVKVTDRLPLGLSLQEVTVGGSGSFNAATGLWNLGGGSTYNPVTGVWSVGSLAASGAGSTATLQLVTRVNAADADPATAGSQPIVNTVSVTADQYDPNSGNNQDAENVDVGLVDLSLFKQAEVSSDGGNTWLSADTHANLLVNGNKIRYTVTLNNEPFMDTATGVQVSETLPSGVTWDGAPVLSGGIGATYSGNVWSLGLASGSTATMVLTGTINNPLQLANVVEIIAADQHDRDSTPNNGDQPGEDDYAQVKPGIAMITGKVLDDRSGNNTSTFDAGDQGVNGVTIKVFANGADINTATPIATTTTDANGVYTLYVPAGNYMIVQINKSGYSSIASLQAIDPLTGAVTLDTTDPGHDQRVLAVTAGNEYYENNFLDIKPWTISGHAYVETTADGVLDGNNEAGQGGVTVTLLEDADNNGSYETTVATKVTDQNGAYAFGNLGIGRYRVVQTNQSGYTDVMDRDGNTGNTLNQIDVTLFGNAPNKTDADFLDRQNAGTITGRVMLDYDKDGALLGDAQDTGLAGVTVELRNASDNSLVTTTTSDANGNFSFAGISAGNYKVVEINPTDHNSVDDSDGGNDDVVNVALNVGGNVSGVRFLDVQVENTAPQAQDNTYTVDEAHTLTGNMVTDNDDVDGQDSDVDNDPLLVTEINGGTFTVGQVITLTHGSLTVTDTNGGFTYTPNANDNSGDSFDYTISDGNGGTSTATVHIHVTPANDAPDARNNSYAVTQGNTLTGGIISDYDSTDGLDSDVENDVLQVTRINSSAFTVGQVITLPHGSLTITSVNGAFTYTPNANDNSGDTFTYTVSDGHGGTDTATVTIRVDDVSTDEPPPVEPLVPPSPPVPPAPEPAPEPQPLVMPQAVPDLPAPPAPRGFVYAGTDTPPEVPTTRGFPVRVDEQAGRRIEHELRVDKAIPDQLIKSGMAVLYVVPVDAFVHTDATAQVELTAKMINDQDLPSWLSFDAKKGEFKGVPPEGFKGLLIIKVVARDDAGRTAETIVRINVGEKINQISMHSKASLTAQIRATGIHAWKAERDQLIRHAKEASSRGRAAKVA